MIETSTYKDKRCEFDNTTHTYTLYNADGTSKELISVTRLLKKHGIDKGYGCVDQDTLDKAAAKGTLIHDEIENYIKHGEVGFTDELEYFIDWLAQRNVTPLHSELIVFNDVAGGKIDLVCKVDNKLIEIDYKTVSAPDKYKIAWQLSLYADMYEKQYGEPIEQIGYLHLRPEGLKEKPLEFIPKTEVERLFECERRGELYTTIQTDIPPELIARAESAENYLIACQEREKQAQQEADEIRKALLAYMQERAIKSFETERLKITVKDSCTRESIDSVKLKKDHPDIAKTYTKTSTVKASLTIKVKDYETTSI